jgi:hypothetical protein
MQRNKSRVQRSPVHAVHRDLPCAAPSGNRRTAFSFFRFLVQTTPLSAPSSPTYVFTHAEDAPAEARNFCGRRLFSPRFTLKEDFFFYKYCSDAKYLDSRI